VVTYEPDLPPDEVAWIRHWHERAYVEGRSEVTRTFTHLGRHVVVPPHVQPVVGMAHVLGSPVLAEVQAGDRVLDMGTGSGVNAVLAASASTSVVAVDVNPHAVAAARHNAELNSVADRVQTRLSDVFSAVPERFDLILFDPPFRWFAPRDWFEQASTDEGYRALTTFMREARDHLNPAGRMLISFGTTGDLGFLHRLIDEHRFRRETVAHDTLTRDDRTVDYFTYRLH
jgi:release factor glutamine methyltransferase